MNSGSSRYRSALVREDAYFSEVDQILLANLRETLELQEEAARCASGRDVAKEAQFDSAYESSLYSTA